TVPGDTIRKPYAKERSNPSKIQLDFIPKLMSWYLAPKFGRFHRDESALPKRPCGDETTVSRHQCLEPYRRDSALSYCYRGGKQGQGYPVRQVRDVALR